MRLFVKIAPRILGIQDPRVYKTLGYFFARTNKYGAFAVFPCCIFTAFNGFQWDFYWRIADGALPMPRAAKEITKQLQIEAREGEDFTVGGFPGLKRDNRRKRK
ncbi:hypothetical protein [Parasutterella muris]|uniref:hypothetical protein n=1 Tax=Parasutterella muris TaxID=2565572 RepID=UPI00203DD910|nr:hypothetical protein [Parasutterella muris]